MQAKRHTHACLAAVALGCLAAIGCGGAGSKPIVEGTVSYKGSPLPGGKLLFYAGASGAPAPQPPGRSKQPPPAAYVLFIRPDGSFQGTAPPPGDYKIAIQNSHLEIRTRGLAPSYAKKVVSDAEHKLGKYVPLPARYTDPARSGLTLSIAEGLNHQDIALR